MEIRLDNMVASAYFSTGKEIDLHRAEQFFENAVYDKKTFPALVIRFFEEGTTVLLFSSGKAIITGAKNMEQIYTTVSKIMSSLPEVRNASVPSVEIVNMVFSIKMGTPFNLETLALSLPNVEYDPEQFTGLVYRPKGMKTVLLVFASGNMVCSGAKDPNDVIEALKKFYNDAEKYGLNLPVPGELAGGDEEW